MGVKIGEIPSGGSGAQVDADFRHLLERLPRGRKGSNKLFEGFRGVGKAQTGCLKVSEASEGASGTLAKIAGYQENTSQAAAAAPRPRKCSAACFDAFRALGNVQRRVLMLSEASETFSGVF